MEPILMVGEVEVLGLINTNIKQRHRPYGSAHNEYTLPTHSIRRVLEHDHGGDYPVTFHMERLVSFSRRIGPLTQHR